MSAVHPTIICPMLGYLPGDPPITEGKWRSRDVSPEHVLLPLAAIVDGLRLEYPQTPVKELREVACGERVSIAMYLRRSQFFDKGDKELIVGRMRELAGKQLAAGREQVLATVLADYSAACDRVLAELSTKAAGRAAYTTLEQWDALTAPIATQNATLTGILNCLGATAGPDSAFLAGASAALAATKQRLVEMRSQVEAGTAKVENTRSSRTAELTLGAADRQLFDAKIDQARKQGWHFAGEKASPKAITEGVADFYLRYGELWIGLGASDPQPTHITSFQKLVDMVEEIVGKGDLLPPPATTPAVEAGGTS